MTDEWVDQKVFTSYSVARMLLCLQFGSGAHYTRTICFFSQGPRDEWMDQKVFVYHKGRLLTSFREGQY